MITNKITYCRPTLDTEYDYVGIIDGLNQKDRDDFKITEEIVSLLQSEGLTTATTYINTKEELLGALEAFYREAKAGERFMLHFVSHGNNQGIKAGSDFVKWDMLRPFLQRIHLATEETLLINMSTCKGLHGVKIVGTDGDFPFFGLIGAKQNLSVHDALEANKIMYKKWLDNIPVQELVPETNKELNKEVLFNISAEGYRKLSTK